MSFAPPPSSLCHPLHLLRLSSSSPHSPPMYHPNKAQQIMSRYRPIAPKPAPPDRPSAAHDSLASSTTTTTTTSAAAAPPPPPKHRRSRKRRSSAAPPAAAATTCSSSPLPKIARRHSHSSASLLAAVPAISAGISNTGAASSLTQGNSDAAVPLRPVDLMWASPGASSSAADDSLEVSNTRIAISAERQSSLEQQQQTYPSEVRWGGGGAGPVPAATAAHGCGYGSPAAPMFLAIPAPKLISPPPPQPPPHHHFPVHRLGGAFLPCPASSDTAPPVVLPKDIAFIDRGVAVPLPDRSPPPPPAPPPSAQNVKGVSSSSSSSSHGGFTEMIRGIMRLPTAADVQSLMQVRAGSGVPAASASLQEAAFCNIPRSSSAMQQGREMDTEKGGPGSVQIVPQYAGSLGGTRRSAAVGKPEMDEDRNRLVTLNLLPDVPSKAAAAEGAQEMVPIEFLATDASRWRAAAASDISSSSTKAMYGIPGGGGLQVSGSPPSSSYAAATTIPEGVDRMQLLEQIHGASADPVLLLDERDRVIWYNRAYERALKSASERSVGGSTTGPYIDPLGHPTPLGTVEFSGGGGISGKTGATLWGFLKKLVIQEPARGSAGSSSSGRVPGDESLEYYRSCLRLGGEASGANKSLMEENKGEAAAAAAAAMVIGEPPSLTTVTLEKVMEMNTEVEAMEGEAEEVEAELAAGKEPAFITDGRNRVRWMNTAFKRMVGGGEGGGGPPEMTFLCCADRMPRAAAAFSGCVNLEWAKAGKRRSMMVPCDVKKMVMEEEAAAAESGGGGRTDGCRNKMWWWVWRFDVAVSLSLHSPPAF